MNYRFWLALVSSLLTFQGQIWAMSCKDVFASSTVPQEYQHLFEVQGNLRSQLRDLQSGQANGITPTPDQFLVEVFVRSGPGFSLRTGRILSTERAGGEVHLVFVAGVNENGNGGTTTSIPISAVDADSAVIRNTIDEHEQQTTAAQLIDAVQKGGFVKYVDQFGGLRVQQGIVERIERNDHGKIASFVLVDDDGISAVHSINSVVPGTIRTLPMLLRPQTEEEKTLLSKLESALGSGSYVSFIAKRPAGPRSFRFEGWVTSIAMNTQGEYLVLVNKDSYHLGKGNHRYRLSDIVASSFADSPELQIQASSSGDQPTSIAVYLGNERLNDIPDSLIQKLSAFAESNQVSGQNLPSELEALVAPGAEARVYFSSGDRQVRLTVRRTQAGEWAFGDTSPDHQFISEDYLSRDGTRYTMNELFRLEHQLFSEKLPADLLRYHMGHIRNSLMNGLVEKRFRDLQAAWSKAIPEDVDSTEVSELLMMDQNQQYHLDRGFVDHAPADMSETERKTLAAIKFLVENEFVYWSSSVGASGIKEGIYAQGEVHPRVMWPVNREFQSSLIRAMESAGFEFTNASWR